jgi:MoxR-like ATPase
MGPLEAFQDIRKTMEHSVIGQPGVVHALLIALLTNGNVLLEGVPGTAKTRSIKTLAHTLDAQLGRIQFTPDLLPSDITGTEIYREIEGRHKLVFEPGPVFNNFILADEINRAPPKVQSALLEAMEERQVTIAGKTYPLPKLIMVLATQNPIEHEGTFPLPEAQTDRFIMKVPVGYPEGDAELDVIRLVRSEELLPLDTVVSPVAGQEAVFEARKAVHDIYISENVERYIVSLVQATRHPDAYESDLKQWIEVGASPRAGIALDKCARANAWLSGREFADPDDVRAVVYEVLRHRLILTYEAVAEGVSPDDAIRELLKQVAVA